MIAVQLQDGIPRTLGQLRAAAFTATRPVLQLAKDVIARRFTLARDPTSSRTCGTPSTVAT
jgi:hypothetical protein